MLQPERHQLVVDRNRTDAEDQCIHELFESQVTRDPNATVATLQDRSLSYGELNARANRLAHHLRNLRVIPDSRVAICMERSLEMVVGLLAILKAGGGVCAASPSQSGAAAALHATG